MIFHWRNIAVFVLMLIASGLGIALKPTERAGEPHSKINLEQIIPKKFGDWILDERVIPIMPAPDQQAKIDLIYDESLARTYFNSKREFVMLSIAYGGDQTGRLRVHRPESCYAAQGFLVKKIAENDLLTATSRIPVKRLAANSNQRHEPITYWIRVGDSTVTSLIGQRLTQLKFGLTGEIPDGLIFRVSSITPQNEVAFALHDRFVSELMAAVPKETRAVLVGSAGLGTQ